MINELALVRDPIFGLPLTPFEREVWLRILAPKKSWRERMHLLLRRATSPFGAGSGGAGGSLATSQLGTVPPGGAMAGMALPHARFPEFR